MLGYALLLRRGLFLAVVSFFFLLFFKVMYLNFKVLCLVSFFPIFSYCAFPKVCCGAFLPLSPISCMHLLV